jgi:hypothetical protein
MPRRFIPILFFASAALAAEPLPCGSRGADGARAGHFRGARGKLLTEHCVKCHGGEKGTKGDLDLATRETLLKGGESGPAIVLWKSGESLLVKSIRHEDAGPEDAEEGGESFPTTPSRRSPRGSISARRMRSRSSREGRRKIARW